MRLWLEVWRHDTTKTDDSIERSERLVGNAIAIPTGESVDVVMRLSASWTSRERLLRRLVWEYNDGEANGYEGQPVRDAVTAVFMLELADGTEIKTDELVCLRVAGR